MKLAQETLDSIQETDMGESTRLFLDISSTCTGFVISKMEGRTCTITRMGVMWFPSDCPNGQKYYQLQQAIGEFYSIDAITDIIYESFHVNPSQVGNSLVVPEMIGAVKAACYDIFGMPIGIEDFSPTAWRGRLGVQPIKTPKLDKNGKHIHTAKGTPQFDRDFKTPVINYMDKLFNNKIPKMLKSNITGNMRSCPNDLYDALGICVGWNKKFGISEYIIAENAIQGHPDGLHPQIN
jgi:hypothetical protein